MTFLILAAEVRSTETWDRGDVLGMLVLLALVVLVVSLIRVIHRR